MGLLKFVTNKHAAVAAAATAAGALANTAHAAITYTSTNLLVSSAGTSTQNIDINNDGSADFAVTASTVSGIQIAKTNINDDSGIVTNVFNGEAPDALALALHTGDVVGPADVTANVSPSATLISADGTTGNFTVSGGPAYIGVSYLPGSIDDADRSYGYIEFQTLSTGTTVSGKILGYAYNSAVIQPITVVPEPASLGMLALGAAGVCAYRRHAR